MAFWLTPQRVPMYEDIIINREGTIVKCILWRNLLELLTCLCFGTYEGPSSLINYQLIYAIIIIDRSRNFSAKSIWIWHTFGDLCQSKTKDEAKKPTIFHCCQFQNAKDIADIYFSFLLFKFWVNVFMLEDCISLLNIRSIHILMKIEV